MPVSSPAILVTSEGGTLLEIVRCVPLQSVFIK
jgi:hypothetical protein